MYINKSNINKKCIQLIRFKKRIDMLKERCYNNQCQVETSRFSPYGRA